MNGATAEPEVKTTKLPSRTRQMIMGNSQNFFRSFIKDQSSNRNSPMNTSFISERLAVSGCSLLPTHCLLLPNTASSNATLVGACGQRGSCRGQVLIRDPWDPFPAIASTLQQELRQDRRPHLE